VVFLLGALIFAIALVRAGQPMVWTGLYALGSVAIGLRGVLPDVTLNPGLVVAGIGLGGLALALYRASSDREAIAPIA